MENKPAQQKILRMQVLVTADFACFFRPESTFLSSAWKNVKIFHLQIQKGKTVKNFSQSRSQTKSVEKKNVEINFEQKKPLKFQRFHRKNRWKYLPGFKHP